MGDDPRDLSAAQDRAARLAALSGRALTFDEPDEDGPTTKDPAERKIVGYYRGQPVYETPKGDDAPSGSRRITYRGRST